MKLIAYTLLYLAATRPTLRDMEFDRVQEAWAAEAGFRSVTESSLPLPFAALNSDRYREREAARFLLRLAGRRAARPLARATHHRSAAVRDAAGALYRQLFRCPACGGDGRCRVCTPDPVTSCRCVGDRCLRCEGAGDLRYTTSVRYWDGRDWVTDLVPKNIFRGEGE